MCYSYDLTQPRFVALGSNTYSPPSPSFQSVTPPRLNKPCCSCFVVVVVVSLKRTQLLGLIVTTNPKAFFPQRAAVSVGRWQQYEQFPKEQLWTFGTKGTIAGSETTCRQVFIIIKAVCFSNHEGENPASDPLPALRIMSLWCSRTRRKYRRAFFLRELDHLWPACSNSAAFKGSLRRSGREAGSFWALKLSWWDYLFKQCRSNTWVKFSSCVCSKIVASSNPSCVLSYCCRLCHLAAQLNTLTLICSSVCQYQGLGSASVSVFLYGLWTEG